MTLRCWKKVALWLTRSLWYYILLQRVHNQHIWSDFVEQCLGPVGVISSLESSRLVEALLLTRTVREQKTRVTWGREVLALQVVQQCLDSECCPFTTLGNEICWLWTRCSRMWHHRDRVSESATFFQHLSVICPLNSKYSGSYSHLKKVYKTTKIKLVF